MFAKIKSSFATGANNFGKFCSRVVNLPLIGDLFIPLSVKEAVRTVNQRKGEEETTSEATRRIMAEVAKAETNFLIAALKIWGILFATSVILPILFHVVWWGCLIYIMCGLIIPPILIILIAKLRLLFYITDAPFLAAELTFSKIWRAYRTRKQ